MHNRQKGGLVLPILMPMQNLTSQLSSIAGGFGAQPNIGAQPRGHILARSEGKTCWRNQIAQIRLRAKQKKRLRESKAPSWMTAKEAERQHSRYAQATECDQVALEA